VTLRKILLLLLVVAALGTYLVVYELPQAEREATKDKLLSVDKEAITGVTLVYPDREIELQKGDKGWRVVRPVEAAADEAAVKGVLAMVVDAEVQRTLDETPQDLASFGLDKPNVVVRLTAKDATPPPIAVGKNTAIGGKTYVRKGDEPKLYLTTTAIQTGLNKQVKDLRDKQLLSFQDADVTRVDIRRASGDATTLTRGDGDSWTVAPDQLADATEVRSYLASLRAARATDFPDDAPQDVAHYGLDAPRITVTVTGKEGVPPQTLRLGGERKEGSAQHVYAQREGVPTVFALGDWSYRALDKGANQFRDKTVLKIEPTKVTRVELVRRDGGSVVLVRRPEGGWRFESGADGKTNEGAVTRLLEDVEELRGDNIAAEPAGDLARFGLAAPDVRLVLADGQGKDLGTLLATKHDGKHYVMRLGGGPVFEVRDYMFARLDRKPSDFVEPTTTTTAPAAGARIDDTSDDEAEVLDGLGDLPADE